MSLVQTLVYLTLLALIVAAVMAASDDDNFV